MSFRFRVRFDFIGGTVFSSGNDKRLVATLDSGAEIKLHAVGQKHLMTSDQEYSINGGNFDTQEEATIWGNKVKDCLLLYSLDQQTPIDLGLYAPEGGLTNEGKEYFTKAQGKPALDDRLGLTVWESPPDPIFHRIKIEGQVGKNLDRFLEYFDANLNNAGIDDEKHFFAGEIFSLASKSGNPRAKYVVLYTCIEILAQPQKQPEEVREFLDSFIDAVKGSSLSLEQKNSLKNGLGNLKKESMKQAGLRLAESLSVAQEYFGKSPVDFFSLAYSLRNSIVHGRSVDSTNLSKMTSELERYVNAVVRQQLS